jgi:4-amino-4-deoxy-L-arabinose transferase-like glycosyltransferase
MAVTPHPEVPQARRAQHARPFRLSGSGWGVLSATTVFIGLTCWWLTQDRSVPVYDAGIHLERAIHYYKLFQTGHVLQPFLSGAQYPPLAYLVGALAAFFGGVSVAPPIIGENLVFVSLLTWGCYQTGRLLFGTTAGLLAAIFALGSPLLIAQFHVFMLDAPETALVAVSMWLLLASEDFRDTRLAGCAGLAVGLGLLVKVTFPGFVAGIVLVALARGGYRHWRGLVAFAVVAFLVASPWYIDHLSKFGEIAHYAGANLPGAPSGNYPPTFSLANLTWYFWNTINSVLLVPLSILALGGALWTMSAVARRHIPRAPVVELLVGGIVAWLAITMTPHHDIRYGLPLLPYFAVIATGWTAYMNRAVRLAAIGVVALAVAANTLGTTFGVGGRTEIKLVSSPPRDSEAEPGQVVLYSNTGFLVAGPKRDGNVPGLLSALQQASVRQVAFDSPQHEDRSDFSNSGVAALSLIAGMTVALETRLPSDATPSVVGLVHRPITPQAPPSCTRLSDGTGVWVVRYDAAERRLSLYCPFRQPSFYGTRVETHNWAQAALAR